MACVYCHAIQGHRGAKKQKRLVIQSSCLIGKGYMKLVLQRTVAM